MAIPVHCFFFLKTCPSIVKRELKEHFFKGRRKPFVLSTCNSISISTSVYIYLFIYLSTLSNIKSPRNMLDRCAPHALGRDCPPLPKESNKGG
jgi:hypothetical protein